MNANQLSRIVLRGFKSIRDCDLELRSLNVLIGPNGAGKSNFISFFKMIQHILSGRLQYYVGKTGGPDAMLHFGRNRTEQLSAELYFGNNGYKFCLEPTQDNRMMFLEEKFWWNMGGHWDIGSGNFESQAEQTKTVTRLYNYTIPVMKGWQVYHFHDTSETSRIKQLHQINDNMMLRADARNLASFLYLMKNQHIEHYQRIVQTIQLAAPFFEDFYLRPFPENKDLIQLEWLEKNGDTPFKAHLLSDGTLRFICLVTVLLQPDLYQPETILIDEPELGLHPYAIELLSALIRSTAKRKQIIISTQSADLLSEFLPEDVIVADRSDGTSNLRRLDKRQLKVWLDKYSLGELWHKNVIGGRPTR